jgi:hypothetical protein
MEVRRKPARRATTLEYEGGVKIKLPARPGRYFTRIDVRRGMPLSDEEARRQAAVRSMLGGHLPPCELVIARERDKTMAVFTLEEWHNLEVDH